jgi:hypothetical protein
VSEERIEDRIPEVAIAERPIRRCRQRANVGGGRGIPEQRAVVREKQHPGGPERDALEKVGVTGAMDLAWYVMSPSSIKPLADEGGPRREEDAASARAEGRWKIVARERRVTI